MELGQHCKSWREDAVRHPNLFKAQHSGQKNGMERLKGISLYHSDDVPGHVDL